MGAGRQEWARPEYCYSLCGPEAGPSVAALWLPLGSDSCLLIPSTLGKSQTSRGNLSRNRGARDKEEHGTGPYPWREPQLLVAALVLSVS